MALRTSHGGLSVVLLALVLRAGAADTAGPSATELAARDYHMETALVAGGRARAAIVSSRRQPAYATVARQIQARVQGLTGVQLPVLDEAEKSPDAVLANTNAIVLGNLATSRFVEALYWEWYTLTDCWYPGPGGYELRTLHDPYGTGHNAILVGGSDDAGVIAAAAALCELLQRAEPLRLGRLMQIKLGAGCLPPRPKDFSTWVDPRWRIFRDVQGAPLGHTLASKIGLIYYYCGDESAARRFRDLALKGDMLSKANHYYAHMNALVWDLIEESPVFSSEDRVRITQKLLEHVRGPDAAGTVTKFVDYREDIGLLDRHTSMMAIGALTESRYFGKYWPSPEWERNLAAIRKYFNRQMTTAKGDSDLGGRGIYTYLECALIPALLLRDRRFVDSGALRQWGELCLMHCDNTGQMPQSGQSGFLSYPTYVLSACAALLNDGGFLLTLPRREEAERAANTSVTPSSFMTGQAWSTGVTPNPAAQMLKMQGVYRLPLTAWEYEVRGKAVPFAEAFDKLAMRTGFGRDDQYLLLDGLYGGPAGKPWPDVNAIVAFGQNGRILIDNSGAGESPVQHNVVTVSRNGFGMAIDRVAALKAVADLPNFGFSHSRVNHYAFSAWDRHIFWRKGKWFLVMDRLAADGDGQTTFECQWQTVGEPVLDGSNYSSAVWEWAKDGDPHDVLHIRNAEGLPLRYTQQLLGVEGGQVETDRWQHYCRRPGINRVRQVATRRLGAGDEQVMSNLIYVGGERTPASYAVAKLSPRVVLLTGDEIACIGLAAPGGFSQGPFRLDASAFCIAAETVAAVHCTRLEALGVAVQCPEPCNLELDLRQGRLTIETSVPMELSIGGKPQKCLPGRQVFTFSPPDPAPVAAAAAALKRLAPPAPSPALASAANVPVLSPAWTWDAGVEVTALYAADFAGGGPTGILAGLADGRVVCLDLRGQPRWTFTAGGAVHALSHATLGAAQVVLVGSDDQHVYALSVNGGTPLWKHRCDMAPDMAGWTTGQEARVQALAAADLDNDGHAEVLCATGGGAVEALSDTGQRQWLTPIRYGVPDRLAVVPMPDGRKTVLVSCGARSYQSMTRRLDATGRLIDENALYRRRGADMSPAPGLLVADLEGRGQLSAIVGRGGAYPELAVYDATVNGKAKWEQLLADTVGTVGVADLDGDGVAEVIAGSRAGWLSAFSAAGRLIWATPMPHEVVAACTGADSIFVACADAAAYRVSFSGDLRGKHVLKGVPSAGPVRCGAIALVGDTGGMVSACGTGL